MRTTLILLAGLFVAGFAPRSEAQQLHGEWFKVKVAANGAGLDGESKTAVKGKIKPVVFYAQLQANEGGGGDGPSYSLICMFRNEVGEYVPSGGGQLSMLDEAETFVADLYVSGPTLPLPEMEGAPNIFSVSVNGKVKTKMKNKEVKSSRFTSLGAVSYFTNETGYFLGRAKLSMSRVPESKVPFLKEEK